MAANLNALMTYNVRLINGMKKMKNVSYGLLETIIKSSVMIKKRKLLNAGWEANLKDSEKKEDIVSW